MIGSVRSSTGSKPGQHAPYVDSRGSSGSGDEARVDALVGVAEQRRRVAGAAGQRATLSKRSSSGVPLATTRLFIWYVPVYSAARPGAHGAAWA